MDIYKVSHFLPVTSSFAIVFTIFYIILAARVIRYRRSKLISIGDGGSEEIGRAIRAHGNFAEYVPYTMLLLFLLEVQDAPKWQPFVCASLLLIGRVLHARGLTVVKDRKLPFRFWGMLLTFTSQILLVLLLIAMVAKEL